VASELFYREGIRAVGVDTIIAQAGVAKMTFYKQFHSKENLVVEYLKRRDIRWRQWFRETVERYARTNDDGVLAIFDALEERFTATDFRGCAFINTMVEMANRNHDAHQVAAEHKRQVQAFIRQLLLEARLVNPDQLAEQFMLLLDGAIVTALREGSPRPAQAAKQMASIILSASRTTSA
jgi:AcrR family transcriptional regulator